MQTKPQLRHSSSSPRHLMVFRQVQLEKGILLKKNRPSLPESSMKRLIPFNNSFNSTPSSQDCSNIHNFFNFLKHRTL